MEKHLRGLFQTYIYILLYFFPGLFELQKKENKFNILKTVFLTGRVYFTFFKVCCRIFIYIFLNSKVKELKTHFEHNVSNFP